MRLAVCSHTRPEESNGEGEGSGSLFGPGVGATRLRLDHLVQGDWSETLRTEAVNDAGGGIHGAGVDIVHEND